MTPERKAQIDSVWRVGKYGEYFKCVISGNEEKAKEIKEEWFNEGYLIPVMMVEEELAPKLAKEFKGMEEFNEYADELSKESEAVWNFFYSRDLFDYARKLIR